MADPAAPGVGETFGDYTIESVLGRGGMGTVYLATQARLGRKVALKVITPELAYDDDFRARFLRESQLAASLDHPNVIPIYDTGEVDGVLYLAMRYVSGSSLQVMIRTRGELPVAETLRVAEQIGSALDAAHRAGLVHRDVKPANILVAEPDDHAYLCDFGLAKRTSSSALTRTGSFLGSVDYCAPEQIEGRPVDGRADVYSLGSVLFHCLTGVRPYARDTEFAVLQAHLTDPPPTVSAVRPGLPRSLDEVVATAMAKDPNDRYRTAGGLVAGFREAATSTPSGKAEDDATRAAPALSPDMATSGARTAATHAAPRLWRRLRRREWLLAGAILIALLAASVAVVLATRGSSSGSSANGPSAAELSTFADRIENVLAQSAAGRLEIGTALRDGLHCSISPREAARRIASVADNRQSILLQLGSLQAPSPQTARIVTLLQRSLQQSIEADRHYRDGFLTAAARSQTDCPLPSNADFDLASKSDARATEAKERFVVTFNALARQLERRSWLASEI